MVTNEQISDSQLDQEINFAETIYKDAANVLHNLTDEKKRRHKLKEAKNKSKLAMMAALGGKSYEHRIAECMLLIKKQYDSKSIAENYGFNINLETALADENLLHTVFAAVTHKVLDDMLRVTETGAPVKRRYMVNVMRSIHRKMEHPKVKAAMKLHKVEDNDNIN